MKKFVLLFFILILFPSIVSAKRGCCSRHGGVCGCASSGRQVCCDGTLSPSCTCNPPKIYGCTDPLADNYNPNANYDNKKCKYTIYGCMDKKAKNYNSKANKSDNSCLYDVLGCTDKRAQNYNKLATINDGSCEYNKGCTDNRAINYNDEALIDDNSCEYIRGCTDKQATNYNKKAVINDNSCKYQNDDGGSVIPILALSGVGYYTYKKYKNKKIKNGFLKK